MADLPPAPKHLTARSRRLWVSIVDEFAIDDPAGLEVLRLSLEAIDRTEQARKLVHKEGLTWTDRLGNVRPHPALKIEQDNRTAAFRGLRELALSPEVVDDVRPPRIGGR